MSNKATFGKVSFDGEPPAGVINLGIGQPSADLLPVELLRKASEDYYSVANPRELNYGEKQGDIRFRESLADFLSHKYRVDTGPDHLMEIALDSGWVNSGGAVNHVTSHIVRHAIDVVDMRKRSFDHGVGFQPGEGFTSTGDCGNFIRLSFAHYNETDIYSAVDRLAGMLKGQGSR